MKNLTTLKSITLIALCLTAPLSFATTSTVSNKTALQQTADNVSQATADTAITAKIKALYASEKVFGDKDISVLGVTVETTNGIVRLNGHVTSEDQVANAVKIAKSVKGVKKVIFNLKVN